MHENHGLVKFVSGLICVGLAWALNNAIPFLHVSGVFEWILYIGAFVLGIIGYTEHKRQEEREKSRERREQRMVELLEEQQKKDKDAQQ